jgi:SpoVK/Ycf46/Vps4 family AAA+-type ATPase
MATAKAAKTAVPAPRPVWKYDPSEGSFYVHTPAPAEVCFTAAEPGVWRVNNGMRGPFITKTEIVTDKLIRVTDTPSDLVIRSIENFWGREEQFKKYGQIFKRGILLYGPPGSGKTVTIQLILEDFVRRGGVVIVASRPDYAEFAIGVFRSVEPTRRMLIVMEDIDNLRGGYETELCTLLDGQSQHEGIVFLATTNYIDRLPDRLKNRPSRFDERIEIGMPDERLRRAYLESRVQGGDATSEDLTKWVAATEGFSIAHLREFVVSVMCLGLSVDDTVERLKTMLPTQLDSDNEDEDDDDYEEDIPF